jgi:dephospho-CoA kinase
MFGHAERVATVNGIVHPAVRADFRQWAQQTGKEVVAVESAILYEAGMEDDVDAVWVVHAPQEMRLQRAVLRDAANEEAIRNRMHSQLSEQAYLQRADKVLHNDGKSALIEQVRELLASLRP